MADGVIQNNYFTDEKINKIIEHIFYRANPEFYAMYYSVEVIYDKYRRESQFLDVSDRSYQNLTEYNDLIKLGATEVTTDRQLKKRNDCFQI